ncbi:preprotein translocase subunit SecG [Methylobacterium organophilum]|uniref:preprotein translocase subunit SecG n=1 Tax=Methylobacterium organophilum TaxID=410 RepID=UPI001F13D88E|nr:preprotein translocase subunit SecG [Methylobacterium organophilum]UMY16173.1 preprotein translocase subunit SecG [Methylobacterium organophilum]
MQTVLIVVHLIIVLALIAVVLLQRSEGGLGLGGGGSGVSGFMTGRGQANALTRATAILAALFFTTSITLAILAHRSGQPRSILDGAGTTQPAPQQPQDANSLLDTLRKQGGGEGAPANPAPQAPAAPPQSAPAPATPAVPDAPQSR